MPALHNVPEHQQSQQQTPYTHTHTQNPLTPRSAVSIVRPTDHRCAPSVSLQNYGAAGIDTSPPVSGRDSDFLQDYDVHTSSGSTSSDDVALAGTSSLSLIDTSGSRGLKRRQSNRSSSSLNAATGSDANLTDTELGLPMSARASGMNLVASPTLLNASQDRLIGVSITGHARERSADIGQLNLTAQGGARSHEMRVLSSADIYRGPQDKRYLHSREALSAIDPRTTWQSAGAYSMSRTPSSDWHNSDTGSEVDAQGDVRAQGPPYGNAALFRNATSAKILERAKMHLHLISARVINVRHQRSDSTEPQVRLLDGESGDETEASDDDTLHNSDLVSNDKLQTSSRSGHGDAAETKSCDSGRGGYQPAATWDHALRGKTLSYFDRHSRIRRSALAVLMWSWTEPMVLVLIVLNIVILAVQSAPSAYAQAVYRGSGYFHTWEDGLLFAIFVCFTLEIVCRILVSGFLFDPVDNDTRQPFSLRPGGSRWWTRRIWRNIKAEAGITLHGRIGSTSAPRSMGSNLKDPHIDTMRVSTASLEDAGQRAAGTRSTNVTLPADKEHAEIDPHHISGCSTPMYPPKSTSTPPPIAALTDDAANQYGDVPFLQSVQAQRLSHVSHKRAYLRSSWNRLDLLAVVSFWISFTLAISGVEGRQHIYIFRALSTLRGARLLTITVGTSTILRSLKQSAPIMVNVAFFVIFAMLLFSIIGVQSFQGSFKRTCFWSDGVTNVTTSQFCGGHVDAHTFQPVPFMDTDGSQLPVKPKGFICPIGQICLEQSNPFNNTQSFDNALTSLLQVIVIMSSNTWTGLMYSMIDAEYFVSSLFFVVCLILLNIWLVNIFIAVIINTFGNIREETKHSAFAADSVTTDEGSVTRNVKRSQGGRVWRAMLSLNKYFWLAVIIADVGVQASKTAKDTASRVRLLNDLELYFTLAFIVEIGLRFMLHLPDWRRFGRNSGNLTDLSLAVTTCVIQIPAIHRSAVYPWMTVFQLLRFYRVIIAIPRMRALLAKMLSSTAGLLNMLAFLLLMNFFVAVISVQFLRGDVAATNDEGGDIQWSFYQIYNAFLSIYVIFSSENWTTPLYDALGAEVQYNQAFISGIFLAGWFMFANFILLQMFIAVINEGFAMAEADKLKAQAEAHAKRHEVDKPTINWISRISPYRSRVKTTATVAQGISIVSNPALAYTRLGENVSTSSRTNGVVLSAGINGGDGGSIIASIKHIIRKRRHERDTRHQKISPDGEEAMVDVDKNLDLLILAGPSRQNPQRDGALLQDQQQSQQNDVLTRHPLYDHALCCIPQSNKLRQLCQRMTEPAYGQRLSGRKPYRTWTIVFKLVILSAIVASVTIAAVATPVYRRNYYVQYRHIGLTWFNAAESALGFIFVTEFLVKVIADGFAFTPNAYLLSVWNLLDLFVLATLVVDISTSLSTSNASVNRFIRSLKAFRALRLINLSATMRKTFYDVMIVGASRILDASILTILYIIPFSIWGQNLFSGLLYSCNDSSIMTKVDCVGEYWVSPAGWRFLVPRVWQNPSTWSFDTFRSAFLILFEIVSLEGWTAVMASGMAIVGRDQQSQKDASQYNSIFFLVYNLIGAIVVLTLFVSIIIENFSVRSGMALLTTEQRQWLDLKKLLIRQRPAKQPSQRPSDVLSAWCHDRAMNKHGWWSRSLTALYLIHIAILLSQTDAQPQWAYTMRDWMFVALTLVYAVDIAVRLIGLGWRNYSHNGWNIYDIFVVSGTFATTMPILLGTTSQTAIQLQKLFLVSISFKLVQKNDSLNQLFKTAIASLPAILSVFGLWLTLFLVWAILFLENFSLTKWCSNETWRQNYSTFPQAMLMLTLMSTGEGWNSFMHDYTLNIPFCSPSNSYLFTDCGSPTAAYILFISWNILSMYIFLNMLTGVVVENFSFVFSLYGKTITVGREDMRKFKRAWAKFDAQRQGRIQRRDLMAFLKSLDGILDVNVLYSRLNQMDQIDVKSRRRNLNRIYQDALLAEDAKGIPFTSMLLILAHYKLIDPCRSLQLQERYEWEAKTEVIDDLIRLDRVRSLIRTRYWRGRFLRSRQTGQAHVEYLKRNADDTLCSI